MGLEKSARSWLADWVDLDLGIGMLATVHASVALVAISARCRCGAWFVMALLDRDGERLCWYRSGREGPALASDRVSPLCDYGAGRQSNSHT